jgi:hypothetical protein
MDDAARFIDEVGLVLLFPAPEVDAPSLWEAVAGPGRVPFADGMNEAESLVWAWKDELPAAGLAWYGTFLFRRKSLLSPAVLASLYAGAGLDDDHRSLDLCREAHQIADALRPGPLTTAALREIVGNRSRYERAIGELNRALLVTSGGVEPQRSGWPAGVVELTCRAFTVGGALDRTFAARRFLAAIGAATARDVGRALGWPVNVARELLDGLVVAGDAVRADGVYRPARPGPTRHQSRS